MSEQESNSDCLVVEIQDPYNFSGDWNGNMPKQFGDYYVQFPNPNSAMQLDGCYSCQDWKFASQDFDYQTWWKTKLTFIHLFTQYDFEYDIHLDPTECRSDAAYKVQGFLSIDKN